MLQLIVVDKWLDQRLITLLEQLRELQLERQTVCIQILFDSKSSGVTRSLYGNKKVFVVA